jgi:hypothetical protein
VRARTSQAFNVRSWTGATPVYTYSVNSGTVTSSTGSLY